MLYSDPFISMAEKQDAGNIAQLLNSAYRGEGSKKGWTTEAHLITGEVRSTPLLVEQTINTPGSVILKFVNEEGQLLGCINLQEKPAGLYLGMFSVLPNNQGAGIGKKLLFAAESYAISRSIDRLYMTVISVRTELINWYIRHGYRTTEERIPFHEDGVSGRHVQELEFIVLEKFINTRA